MIWRSPSRGMTLLFAIVVCGLAVGCGTSSTIAPPVASVASTQNPLVAQVTISSSCLGQAMVEFGTDTSYGRSTSWYPVPPHYAQSTILVAGMKASTTYHMRARVQCAGQEVTGQDLTFATGALPSLPFPTVSVSRPNPALSSSESPGIELINIPFGGTPPIFTDRDGNVIWFYDVGAGNLALPFKLLPNGHVIVNIVSPTSQTLREIDLAGNTIREMTISSFASKVQGAGYDFAASVGGFHHEVLPLDNGHVVVLLSTFKNFTDLPGYPGTLQVVGDAVVDLDENWNPVWGWNSFDYLDINRHLNGLPDWTHSNALVYLPEDGNLLISMRHQSWVLKLDYQNGTGSGRVLWKLGYQGDFALAQDPSGVQPWLWFSFQHFPSLISQDGQKTTLAIWDNGDGRVMNTSGQLCVDPSAGTPACYARPTIFQLDEGAMVANLSWSTQLPYYSIWGGSINQLANGNIEFDANDPELPPAAGVSSEVQEITQTSTPQVIWKMDFFAPMYAYRAYRIPSLYPGVTWAK